MKARVTRLISRASGISFVGSSCMIVILYVNINVGKFI